MMHYGSWMQSPNVLENHHRMYTQYIEDSYRTRMNHEDDCEQTGDENRDTMTSATSGERSSSADIFRLEFAATQWSKLVSNAEGLFSKLVASDILPHNEQDQIKQWLCMKQEYEECITSDDAASIPGFQENQRRSLERIEEVTETDDRTDESEAKFEYRLSSETESEMSEEEEEEEASDGDSDNPDFLEKLDECMNKLKLETDRLIDSIDEGFQEKSLAVISTNHTPNNNNDYVPIIKPTPIRNPNSRRNSMLPGSEMCNEVIAFNGAFRPCVKTVDEEVLDNARGLRSINGNLETSTDLLLEPLRSYEMPEPIKTLKTLAMNNEAKQTQVKKIQSDLEGAQRRIEELETTIKIKEKFISDMVKNSDAKATAKQKLQRKRSKLEEQYYNTRTQLAHAENSMYRDEEASTPKREIELYKNMAIHYEKRMNDLEMIKQMAGDSAKKVLELESSLNSSKKQMEKLKRQLKKEEERKSQLEDEVAEDQKKIRDLEEKYNLTASKLKEMQSESEDERSITRSRAEDKKKNLLEMSARISHLDHVLKEKSMDLERAADIDEKQALRVEIENLRRTKEGLLEAKCNLDSKLKENPLSMFEERKRLECGEAIEMVDVMIEQKNEKICGRKCFDPKNRKDMEMMLIKQLSNLSLDEIVKLFTKYFYKVIDLKESGRCFEMQLNEAEQKLHQLELCNRDLKNEIKNSKVENERRIIYLRQQHEQKMHMMFRSVADETGSSGYDKDSEVARYKRENKSLKKRVQDLETLFRASTAPVATSPARLPQQEIKPIANSAKTTVIRRGRKLIIEKSDCDK